MEALKRIKLLPIVFSLIIKIFTITCVTSTAISNVNFVFEVFSQKSLVRFFEFNDIGWNISQSCVQNLYSYLDALQKDLKWAYKLLDSSGNYAGGLFYGQHLRPANPEQCNEINKELNSIISDNTNYESVNTLSIVPFFVHLVNAKYSTYVDDQEGNVIIVNLFQRQEIQQTVCMPASCTYEDLMQIMSYTSLLPHQLLKDTELSDCFRDIGFYDFDFILRMLLPVENESLKT
ncbi:CLUMA_CG017565, isoform A [Clunio marinus]|uniref:CLUMA_CG017565, isoform A n=1 Tax=Clunio marinus TaxID=568069 RepID=A0A1J1IY48_9DIPT|nr:CLUMA_CG017565, isoform A [Clunio marinus]